MRKFACTCLFVLLMIGQIRGQQQFAFSFGETPQTLNLNPGAETNFQYHYGIPIFSNFNLSAGLTGFDLSDLFLRDGRNFDSKFSNLLRDLDENDHVNVNIRIDILNGGYRYDEKTYLSFGFYQESDVMVYVPKDLLDFVYEGNAPYLNRAFSFSHLRLKADVLGVLHAGISRKVNSRLNIGARIKIYSSSINIESNNNSGTLTTFENSTNLLRQSLNNFNAEVRTSGLVDENDEFLANPSDIFSKTFLGGNLGLGFDFGMTYHLSPQLEFTASMLDFGFVRYSKNTRVYSGEGDYVFDGLNFQFDQANINYWEQLGDDFKANVPTSETTDAYTSWRPTKLNAALKYSFGEIRSKTCYAPTHKQYYYNAIGFQMHSIFRPAGPQFAFTSFFETSLSEKIHTKLTHTFNEYSATVIGSGMTFQWGNVNVFGMVDNMFGARDLLSASTISVNFGVNMVIN